MGGANRRPRRRACRLAARRRPAGNRFLLRDPAPTAAATVTTLSARNSSWRLVAFVKALIPYRVAHAQCAVPPDRGYAARRRSRWPSRAPAPRGGRCAPSTEEVAADAGTAARIDFRLVDLPLPSEDLEALARLDGGDLRERELAIRGGRIWAPRLISLRERFPHVPADEDAAYRLALDNPGQIGGLQMKSYPRSCTPGSARRRDRGGRRGAQLPRRDGNARPAAVEFVRALRARPHGRLGGERDRAPRRRRRAHLRRRRRGGCSPRAAASPIAP